MIKFAKKTMAWCFIISFLLFGACEEALVSSNSLEMFPNNKLWIVSSWSICCPNITIVDSIFVVGDTIIDGRKNILLKQCRNVKESSEEFGFMKETFFVADVEGGQNVFINNKLYYAFDCVIGDTLHLESSLLGGWVVSSIDTVNSFNTERKRIKLSSMCGDTITWVEGIGSNEGLIYNNYCNVDSCGYISHIEGGVLQSELISVSIGGSQIFTQEDFW